MKGKNSTLDEEPHPFSFEKAFLSAKNYRVIFYISVILMLCRVAFIFSIFLNWEPAEWQKVILSVLYILQEVIWLCILVFIPVMLVLRIIVTCKLKKTIQQLEEVICKRDKFLRDETSKEK